MKYEILDAPDFGMLKLTFERPEEVVVAEAGAMVAMGASVTVETRMRGGLLSAAKRRVLGGESVFQNTFRADPGDTLFLAPPPEGDVRAVELEAGQELFLQSGAYLAHLGENLQLDTKWGGVKAFFGGLGFFMLRVVGPGTLFYCAYGAIHEVPVEGSYTCDTGHIVGFDSHLQYRIRKFGGFKGLFLSGEGLICEFAGHGRLFLQTRNPTSLASFLHPYRRTESRG